MNLFERFEVLEDPRDERGKKYKLIDILIMTIYGLLCGLKDFTNIADFMKLKEDYFTKLLKFHSAIAIFLQDFRFNYSFFTKIIITGKW